MPNYTAKINPETGLTPTQSAFMDRYLEGADVKQIAKELEISRNNYYDWIKTDAWKKELHKRTQERRNKNRRKMEHAEEEAVNTLIETMHGKRTKVQMQAAESILDRLNGTPAQSIQIEDKTAYDLNKRAAEILAQKEQQADEDADS